MSMKAAFGERWPGAGHFDVPHWRAEQKACITGSKAL
jgi:hypothetical protein